MLLFLTHILEFLSLITKLFNLDPSILVSSIIEWTIVKLLPEPLVSLSFSITVCVRNLKGVTGALEITWVSTSSVSALGKQTSGVSGFKELSTYTLSGFKELSTYTLSGFKELSTYTLSGFKEVSTSQPKSKPSSGTKEAFSLSVSMLLIPFTTRLILKLVSLKI